MNVCRSGSLYKKLLSIFLTSLLWLFNICQVSVFAGGEDKEETLSDGTRLIYVSAENIENVLERYETRKQELLEARYSNNESFAFKVEACTIGYGCNLLFSKLESKYLSKLEGKHVSELERKNLNTKLTLTRCGKNASLVASSLIFLYPNYVDYKLGREYCGIDNRENYQFPLTGYCFQWGPDDSRDEGFGVWGICHGLRTQYLIGMKIIGKKSLQNLLIPE